MSPLSGTSIRKAVCVKFGPVKVRGNNCKMQIEDPPHARSWATMCQFSGSASLVTPSVRFAAFSRYATHLLAGVTAHEQVINEQLSPFIELPLPVRTINRHSWSWYAAINGLSVYRSPAYETMYISYVSLGLERVRR